MPFCKIRDLGGIWALGRGRRRRPHTERPATAHSRKHAGQLQRCTLSGVLQPMARHGRNLGRDSSGTNIDTWRAPREMQGTRRNTYHLWDSCAPPYVKKAQCAGGSPTGAGRGYRPRPATGPQIRTIVLFSAIPERQSAATQDPKAADGTPGTMARDPARSILQCTADGRRQRHNMQRCRPQTAQDIVLPRPAR